MALGLLLLYTAAEPEGLGVITLNSQQATNFSITKYGDVALPICCHLLNLQLTISKSTRKYKQAKDRLTDRLRLFVHT